MKGLRYPDGVCSFAIAIALETDAYIHVNQENVVWEMRPSCVIEDCQGTCETLYHNNSWECSAELEAHLRQIFMELHLGQRKDAFKPVLEGKLIATP